MNKDDRFTVFIVSIDRRYPGDIEFSGEPIVSKYFDDIGISHIRLDMQDSYAGLDIIKSLAPDVIFRQSQWEPDFPPAFNTAELSFAKICVLPYGTSMVSAFDIEDKSSLANHYAHDQYYHRMAWKIYCENAVTKKLYQKFSHCPDSKIILTGYPKYNRLLKAKSDPKWPILNHSQSRLRVIWAPHHSVGDKWLGFGVFHLIYNQMLEYAEINKEHFEFVLRPHPALFSSVVSEGLIESSNLEIFISKWKNLDNCILDNSASYGQTFAASDVMITCGLSFLLEYPLFDKPVIFIDSGRHVPFNDVGKLSADCAFLANNFNELVSLLEKIRNNYLVMNETHSNQRLALKSLVIDPFDDPSGSILTDLINSFYI
jgi:CDP-glycerol glycerophosphotransferase (TagB/SpsB family)